MQRASTTWVLRLRPREGSSPRPASSPESVELATGRIGSDAVAWAVETADDLVRSVSAALPSTETAETGFEREACEACLLTALVGLATGQEAAAVRTPPEAVNQVRMSVRQGISIAVVVRTVWASAARAQDALTVEIAELQPEQAISAVREVNQWLAEAAGVYVRDLMAEYDEEQAAWRGRLSEHRQRVLDSLVEGLHPPRAEAVLGLRIQQWHLFAYGWQADEGFVASADADMARFTTDVARTLSANGSLLLPRDKGSLMWWTLRSRPPPDLAERLHGLSPPGWLHVAFGTPGRGVAGLPAAHRSADLARTVASARGTPVELFDEVRLVALAALDVGAASVLVRSVLPGALADDARTRDSRRAALAYLEAGGSRQLAARQLSVAPNTVAYRVARLAELLGRPVEEQRLETMVALRLVDQLPGLLDPA